MNKFKKDDIVYVVNRKGNELDVKIGIVDDVHFNEVRVCFLGLRENRTVNGIPILEFESEEKWKKLPKGYQWNTPLYEIGTIKYENQECPVNPHDVNISDKNGIKILYDYGYLVKEEDKFWGNIESEITKDGFRIVKKYKIYDYHVCDSVFMVDNVYETYEEAKYVVDDYYAELERISNLSYEEWSIEQIVKDLERWAMLYSISKEEKQRVRDYLMSLGKIDEIETRIYGSVIQWKREKNKKWQNIPSY